VLGSPDGRRFAFRLKAAHTATVYALRAGGRPHVIYRHRLGQSGCGAGAGFGWNGPFLLYKSSDGHLALLDSRRRAPRDLRRFGRRLPHLTPDESAEAYWTTDFLR
jgi:hypothetical protein